MKRIIGLTLLAGLLCSCASRSIKPDPEGVRLSREEAPKNCRAMGEVTGTTLTATGTQDEAIANLRKDAADKGANFVTVKEFSAYGTTVTGLAYECP